MEINDNALAALKQKMEAELKQEREAVLAFAARDRATADDLYAALVAQAQETAGAYPEFDLKLELGNAEFQALLRAGLPIRRAYEAVHHQEIVEAALHYGMTHGVPQRPGENALDSQATAATAGGMAGTTRAQRDAIRSRVSRGETVRL